MSSPLSPLGPLQVRLLPMFPLGILEGGLEVQCLKTCQSLGGAGIDAQLLDYYRRDDRFDLLHLFGSTENYYDICQQVAGRWPIVISAVTGAPSAAWWRGPIWSSVSRLAAKAKLPTSYSRMRSVYHLAAAVICLNQLEADFLARTYGLPRERIRIISNGVDDRNFQAEPRLFVEKYGISDFVLYTGNIVQRKNPVNLAEALSRMGLPGLFIGRRVAAEEDYGERFAAIVDRSPKLHWIEGLAHDDPLLASAYAGAKIFCLPSTSETQSLSALEAMAAGAPILLGDYPYARQSPFESALRCDPLNSASIEMALARVMAEPDRYRHQLPQTYRWNQVAARIADLYHEICDR